MAIASPPTDCGIGILAEKRQSGRLQLLTFSQPSYEAARAYMESGGVRSVEPARADYFTLRFADGSLGASFGNCFFDYVEEARMASVLAESARVLAPGGLLIGAYLRPATSLGERLWVAALAALGARAGGVHPVQIDRQLESAGFRLELSRDLRSRGCPIREDRLRTPCLAVAGSMNDRSASARRHTSAGFRVVPT